MILGNICPKHYITPGYGPGSHLWRANWTVLYLAGDWRPAYSCVERVRVGCSCDVKPQHHVSKGLVQGSDRFAAGRVCVWLVRGGPNIKRSSITQNLLM